MERYYTPVPHEWLEEMEELSDEEFGRLIRFCLAYAVKGEKLPLIGNEKFYSKYCLNVLDRFIQKWETATEQKREAGRKGAAVRWQTMADDSGAISANGTECQNIAASFSPMADDSRNGYTYTNTNTYTDTKRYIDNISSVDLSEKVEKPVENSSERKLPKWTAADVLIKEEVSQISKDLYARFVPDKQLQSGVVISIYNMIASVDETGKVYVDADKARRLEEGYRVAQRMGKAGNVNVINYVMHKEETA